jgi:hypothetical protein
MVRRMARRRAFFTVPLALAAVLVAGGAGALADGGSCTTAFGAVLDGPNDAPQIACAAAILTATPSPASPGIPVRLDASESTPGDAGGSIARYEWDFGDGDSDLTTAPDSSILHTYARGNYLLHLTIDDARGDPLDATSLDLTVGDPPVASLAAPTGTLRPQIVYDFDASGSADPDPSGSVDSYEWDWGDGTTSETTTPRTTHRFLSDGASRAVSVTVVNDLGLASAPATAAVTVHNEPPLVQLTAPTSVPIGQRLMLDAAGSSDPDGTLDHFEWDLDANGSYEKTTDALTTSVTAGPFPNPGPIVLRVRAVDDSRAKTVVGVVVNVTGSGGAHSGGSTGGGGGSGSGSGSSGAGASGGGGASGSGADGTASGAFSVGLGGSAIQRLAGALKRGVGLTATANRAAGGTLALTLGARDARTLGVPRRHGKRPVRIGSVRLTLRAGRTAKPSIKLTRGAKAALKRKHPRALRVTIRGRIAAGATSATVVRVVLLRG